VLCIKLEVRRNIVQIQKELGGKDLERIRRPTTNGWNGGSQKEGKERDPTTLGECFFRIILTKNSHEKGSWNEVKYNKKGVHNLGGKKQGKTQFHEKEGEELALKENFTEEKPSNGEGGTQKMDGFKSNRTTHHPDNAPQKYTEPTKK